MKMKSIFLIFGVFVLFPFFVFSNNTHYDLVKISIPSENIIRACANDQMDLAVTYYDPTVYEPDAFEHSENPFVLPRAFCSYFYSSEENKSDIIPSSVLLKITNSRKILGLTTHNGITRPFIWTLEDGLKLLPIPPNSIVVTASDINEKGEAVGTALCKIGNDFFLKTLKWEKDSSLQKIIENHLSYEKIYDKDDDTFDIDDIVLPRIYINEFGVIFGNYYEPTEDKLMLFTYNKGVVKSQLCGLYDTLQANGLNNSGTFLASSPFEKDNILKIYQKNILNGDLFAYVCGPREVLGATFSPDLQQNIEIEKTEVLPLLSEKGVLILGLSLYIKNFGEENYYFLFDEHNGFQEIPELKDSNIEAKTTEGKLLIKKNYDYFLAIPR
ncbi:MAG: hypothetical protein Tsb0021_11850 [Chlamydiales bacterium]